MLTKIFSIGLDLFAIATPISLAATNIIFFPLAAVWLFGAVWTWPKWPPLWGWPEKIYLLFLGVSLLSAMAGVDPVHSFREIKNKDLYILILIVVVALARDRAKQKRLVSLFLAGSVLVAVWGLVQWSVGVNQTDKSDGIFLYLPAALAHWPRPVLNLLSILNGRVMGTRGHPLAYAECLLFAWAFTICFLMRARGREWVHWLTPTILISVALVLSQSRGPWIAAAFIFLLASLFSLSRRTWVMWGVGAVFVGIVLSAPAIRDRALSIMDRTHHSNKERMHMWHAGIVIWKSHPLLGVGPGNVKQLSVPFQTTEERVWGPWGHLHSIYMNFLAERGVLGLIAFFLFIGTLVWELGRGLRMPSRDPWTHAVYQSALLGILGFLIGGLTESLYNTAVVNMTFYFVMGLALASSRHDAIADA